ncbi:hypothetical protein Afil01_66420 [Actinorhabdospora filicis]|uniref:Uncharacterized protein n=1 Tax=Actinorhabdospora filicis TaxID=1785913 RepID=A0A9W6SS00_9ACTN|nr:hypothetical protein [Actinorhabdospora filicis]GLZ81835.1 hypothetical protein Afil01_66420 [Actinorhabdospora filicis]
MELHRGAGRARPYEMHKRARERRARQVGRLCRRILLPLLTLLLVGGLGLAAYATLGGDPASYEAPYRWSGGPVYLAGGAFRDGGAAEGEAAYAECLVRPDDGEVRAVGVPAGGLALPAWFTGAATVTCGRSVSVTSGPQVLLYPYALNRTVLVALAALTVVVGWAGFRLGAWGSRPG